MTFVNALSSQKRKPDHRNKEKSNKAPTAEVSSIPVALSTCVSYSSASAFWVPKARQTQPTSYVRRNENEIERHLPVADNGSKQICRRTKVGRNLGVMVEGRKTWRVWSTSTWQLRSRVCHVIIISLLLQLKQLMCLFNGIFLGQININAEKYVCKGRMSVYLIDNTMLQRQRENKILRKCKINETRKGI